MSRLHIYTVMIFETGEPRIETNWTSYPAARSFAEKIFLRSKVWGVKIWNGYAPEDPEGLLTKHDDLLLLLLRGIIPETIAVTGTLMPNADLGQFYIPQSGSPGV